MFQYWNEKPTSTEFGVGMILNGSRGAEWQRLALQLRHVAAELTSMASEVQQSPKQMRRVSEVDRKLAGTLWNRGRTEETMRRAHKAPAPSDRTVLEAEVITNLTAREIQVLLLIGEGKRMKAIAGALGIAAKTVVSYRSNLAEKLKIHDASNLVRFASAFSSEPDISLRGEMLSNSASK